jgi:hypothetical protein
MTKKNITIKNSKVLLQRELQHENVEVFLFRCFLRMSFNIFLHHFNEERRFNLKFSLEIVREVYRIRETSQRC